jgi:hypothetical protein
VLKLNGLMMGLNIKKDSSLISLEGEVRKDGQANGGAYPIMQFNIIYIMRTHVVIRGVLSRRVFAAGFIAIAAYC